MPVHFPLGGCLKDFRKGVWRHHLGEGGLSGWWHLMEGRMVGDSGLEEERRRAVGAHQEVGGLGSASPDRRGVVHTWGPEGTC